MARVRVGISGWSYPRWRGDFYPSGLVQRRELEYAAERFGSVEINGSFYSLQRPSTYREWRDKTPDDFVFAVKGGRFITHMKRLKEVEAPLANFLASGVLALEKKLGPILWQLPASFGFDEERFASFFSLLPRTTQEAAQLAERHDDKVPTDRALTTTEVKAPLTHAVEARHDSFTSKEAIALFRKHDVALVVSDAAGEWPLIEEKTSSFRYVRLHGHTELYASGYSDKALDGWARKIRGWSGNGQDVYVYFDNDALGHAPYDALKLWDRLEK